MKGIVFTGTTVTLVPSLAKFSEDLSCSDRTRSELDRAEMDFQPFLEPVSN